MKIQNLLLVLLLGAFQLTQAQEHNKKLESQHNQQPIQGTWQVEKEYDSSGKLIRYDSLYTYSTTSVDELPKALDSLLKSWEANFKHDIPDTNSLFRWFTADTTFLNSSRPEAWLQSTPEVFPEAFKALQLWMQQQRRLLLQESDEPEKAPHSTI